MKFYAIYQLGYLEYTKMACYNKKSLLLGGQKMILEVNENELKLIKEALLTNSVKYASDSQNNENIKIMGNDWAKK